MTAMEAPAPVQALQADWNRRAAEVLPGGGISGYALPEDLRFVFRRGVGSRLQSVEGRWFVDYVAGAGVNILGHGHPAVVEAVKRQVETGYHIFGALSDVSIQLAEKLVEVIPCAEKVVFTTTGSEAMAYAMRIARAATGKEAILKFEGAYHGNHDYSTVSMFPKAVANYPWGSRDSGGVPEAVAHGVLVAPYNDLDAVSRIVEAHADSLAAIVVEPLQRVILPEPDFLPGLRRLCDRFGLLLIFDEIVTGFRLALGGGQAYFGVTPDLAGFGKILGGGGSIGCVAGRGELIDICDPHRRGGSDYAYVNGTLHGNAVAAAAGLATIAELEQPGFYEDLHARCDRTQAALQEVIDRHGLRAVVAGKASFWQFLFVERAPSSHAEVMAGDTESMMALDLELLRNGIHVLPGMRRFTSAVDTEADLELTVEALDRACRALRDRSPL